MTDNLFLSTVVLGAGLCFYFLPAFLGTKKRNSAAIFWLNLLLGWTLVGWVVALVWALTKDDQQPVVIQAQNPDKPLPFEKPALDQELDLLKNMRLNDEITPEVYLKRREEILKKASQ